MKSTYLKTPLGIAKITGDNEGVAEIKIEDQNIEFQENEDLPDTILQAKSQLREYFEKKRKNFDFKLNPKGTQFQQKVWKALLEIPFGKTSSYMELSKKLGDPKAIRAVASANGKNPLWIVVPCHRVIGSDGSLTGYAGGLHRKKWLLELESPSPQQSLF
ncbi:methylated-DNA--[protein]-cysteine S-methyltransferase [Zunongwangia atlantica]|uniref:Methylated-DNA--protein-cysteine methyltransferase n=1 Tax=Zunongwangia atlantica 22II14-10F7 TaxID=1185767 RepID=A0A1Y1T317_9FLAO|nr:methylated-DNA--[protein]-cysteine S-methyltransferase [Zunongwangia atlantica]ORL45152.1 methylated-DNA--protein-cysteine methyltransferase [Zunongwangia atlantica 22II14-10F7]